MSPFVKELLTRLCIMSVCNFGCFPFLVSRGFGTDCTSSWSLLAFCISVKMSFK